MNSVQLRRILSQDKFTKTSFLDVFPSDQLPMKIYKFPSCFVLNIDKSTEPGSHWVAFYVSSPRSTEFFDSYGNAPSFYGGPILEFAARFKNVDYNPLTLQSNVTAVCGQYCIFYLYSRSRGKTLKELLPTFVSEHITNDMRVFLFVWKYFHVRTPFYQ